MNIHKIHKIERDGKYNIIDINNKILSKIWFDNIYNIDNINNINNKNDIECTINENTDIFMGRVLSMIKNSFKRSNNFIKVELNNKYNIINYNGELLSNIWFDCISPNYDYNNILHVIKNNKENIMNKQGKILSSVWFDSIDYFREKLVTVKKNGKYNIMNINGNLLCNIWFDDIIPFLHGDVTNNQFKVYLNNETYKIDNNGNIKHFCGGY